MVCINMNVNKWNKNVYILYHMHYYWYGTDSVSTAAAANSFFLAAERALQDYIFTTSM